jgi:squalene-hopene/tetraprenyl-beta-curcumene cyclase
LNYAAAIDRAREWIVGMQSVNGGWGAFDADNEYYYLNNIPFADHGALLDPPTEDVSARCLSMLAQLKKRILPRAAGEGDHAQHGGGGAQTMPPPPPSGRSPSPVSLRSTGEDEAAERALAYLRHTQRADGSWYGRWGMNYIYGTWSVLCALNAAGVAPDAPEMRKAVEWLVAIQNPDGGWGEDGSSYKLDYHGYEPAPSTASQTAWAVLGLIAAGALDHPAVARGIKYLADTQGADGFWDEPRYTATGFPRVFYLRYHGYSKYFPLWALARYRNLQRGNTRGVTWGM